MEKWCNLLGTPSTNSTDLLLLGLCCIDWLRLWRAQSYLTGCWDTALLLLFYTASWRDLLLNWAAPFLAY